jgi:hypothetical protein
MQVPDPYRSRMVTFTVEVTAEGGIYRWADEVRFAIGPPQFVIVDDDNGGTRQKKMTQTMDSLSELYAVWDVSTQGDPSSIDLADYSTAFWMTGDSNSTRPSVAGVASMASFLDAGGNIFLTGQDIAENISERPDAGFLSDYFGIEYVGNEQFAVGLGVNGDVISDGLAFNGGASDGAKNQRSPDRLDLTPGSSAVGCYTYFVSGLNAASHIENGYKAVFFGFGFEAISSFSSAQGFNTREEILKPIIAWLSDAWRVTISTAHAAPPHSTLSHRVSW